MAEDVCDVLDSWEDIVENCDLKLSRMSVSTSVSEASTRIRRDNGESGLMAPTGIVDGELMSTPCASSGSTASSRFHMAAPPDDKNNSIKILRRPGIGNGSGTAATSNSQAGLATGHGTVKGILVSPSASAVVSTCTNTSLMAGKSVGKSYDLNNYVNSQPFVPQNYGSAWDESNSNNPRSLQFPQITLEDNTRTQYVPQVKILKRPKEKNGNSEKNKLSPVKNNCSKGSKSYEEREAEYAKARLRILGSAVPTYEPEQLSDPLESTTAVNENNVNHKSTTPLSGSSSRLN